MSDVAERMWQEGFEAGEETRLDIDDALDAVDPAAVIRQVWRLRAGGWEARISVPEGPDENGWYDYTGNEVVGTGPTRTAAIFTACAKAKEAQP